MDRTTPDEKLVETLIHRIVGEGDANWEGLADTPRRVVRSWKELYKGYRIKENEIKEMLTTFDGEQYDEMVILKDIEFSSTCEHHMLPFFGHAHVAYIPKERVVGVSKLARLVEVYSRRLQIQERIAMQVTQAIEKHLKPLGAACVLEARHLCMTCRGVNKQHSSMVTSSLTGTFKKDHIVRSELFGLL